MLRGNWDTASLPVPLLKAKKLSCCLRDKLYLSIHSLQFLGKFKAVFVFMKPVKIYFLFTG